MDQATLADPEVREEIAHQAYLRERSEQVTVQREQSGDDAEEYFTLAWSNLSDDAKRPYRTAVAEALDFAAAHGETA